MTEDMVSLDLILIKTGGGTQSRTGVDKKVVDEYAEAMQSGVVFPPLEIFHDGKDYWLADGFHRHYAASKLGLRSIGVRIHQGTRRDAILHSVGANSQHGLRRTNADKQRAVECLLKDEEWVQWSDREIARRCGVSHDFVNRLRKTICPPMTDTRTVQVERNGTTYTQKVKVIEKPAEIPSLDADLEQSRRQLGRGGVLAVMQEEAGHTNGAIAADVVEGEMFLLKSIDDPKEAGEHQLFAKDDRVKVIAGDKDIGKVGTVDGQVHGQFGAVAVRLDRSQMKDPPKFFAQTELKNLTSYCNELRDKEIDTLLKTEGSEDVAEIIKENDEEEDDEAFNEYLLDESKEYYIDPETSELKEVEEEAIAPVEAESVEKDCKQKSEMLELANKELRRLLERANHQNEELAEELKVTKGELWQLKSVDLEGLRAKIIHQANELVNLKSRPAVERSSLIGCRVKVINCPGIKSNGHVGTVLQEVITKSPNGKITDTFSVQLDGSEKKSSFLESELERIEND